jgi:hypothetical protein
VEGQPVLGQSATNDLESLTELLGSGVEVNPVEADFDGRDAAPDAIEKTALAHLVEHADLVDQTQRVIERQQIDHWPEAQVACPLRYGGEENTG